MSASPSPRSRRPASIAARWSWRFTADGRSLFAKELAHDARDVRNRVVILRAVVVADDAVLVGDGELRAVQNRLVRLARIAAGDELETVDAEIDDCLWIAGEKHPAIVVAHFRCVLVKHSGRIARRIDTDRDEADVRV